MPELSSPRMKDVGSAPMAVARAAAQQPAVSEKAPPAHWQKCGRFYYSPERMHARQLQRLKEIRDFFGPEVVLQVLVPIAEATFDVSLRLLDYCCTNWAKKTRVVLCRGNRTLHLYNLYKDWLRNYRRRCFDPFRRRERILFEHPVQKGQWLETTVAQLNFVRWAELFGIIRYVRANLANIEHDMMRTLSESKRRRSLRGASEEEPLPGGQDESAPGSRAAPKRKRVELSRAPQQKCMVYIVPKNMLFGAADG